jgi:transposase
MMGYQGDFQPKLFYHQINLDQRVSETHILRKIQEEVDFDFIYMEVKDTYGDNGNVSIPPPVILKMMLLLILYNVRSERKLMDTIPLRLDWLWFLGYDLDSEVPDHSVLSKARARWGVEAFRSFFERVVWQCVEAGLVDGSKIFVDSSLVDADAVLTQYDIYLHGYFIYGNIGETEEEMLYIPKFAKEIKLDSITFQKLRIERFSPLKGVVEETPGYYYNRIGGSVYSDRYGRKELKQIRNRIRSEFYDIPQVIHIIRKAWRIGLVSGRDLTNVLLKLPLLMYGLARRKTRREI